MTLLEFLIAALIFSAGYYSAPIFYYNSKNLNCIGALSFFTTRRGVLEKSLFLTNFIGVNFEAGNETREKIYNDFGAEQKWRTERSGFLFISLFSREREIEVRAKFCKRAKIAKTWVIKIEILITITLTREIFQQLIIKPWRRSLGPWWR